MTSVVSFLIGALALLATPGPTNTLLAASGATIGIGKSLMLLAGEVLGYLIAIAVLITVVGPVVMPNFGVAIRLGVGLYLLHVAWRLWQHGGVTLGQSAVTLPRVFVTTLLNPKAAIFAFTLIPSGATGDLELALPWLVALSVLTPMVGTCWIAVGWAMQRSVVGNAGARACCRAGALALTVFAALILVNAVPAPVPYYN